MPYGKLTLEEPLLPLWSLTTEEMNIFGSDTRLMQILVSHDYNTEQRRTTEKKHYSFKYIHNVKFSDAYNKCYCL